MATFHRVRVDGQINMVNLDHIIRVASHRDASIEPPMLKLDIYLTEKIYETGPTGGPIVPRHQKLTISDPDEIHGLTEVMRAHAARRLVRSELGEF